jgi:hypothetical protein
MGLRKQPRALLEVELLAVAEAKAEKLIICRLPFEVEDDLLRTPAHRGVVAHDVRPQPLDGWRAVGEKLFPDSLVNGGVLICQQTDQGKPFALRELVC